MRVCLHAKHFDFMALTNIRKKQFPRAEIYLGGKLLFDNLGHVGQMEGTSEEDEHAADAWGTCHGAIPISYKK